MPTVTGMIGDKIYTVALDGGTVDGDAALVNALHDCHDEEAQLAQLRKLFGDTMKVSEGAPLSVDFPYMADSPIKPGDVTQMQTGAPAGGGGVVDETRLAPPAEPGSVPMGAAAEAVPQPAPTPAPRPATPQPRRP